MRGLAANTKSNPTITGITMLIKCSCFRRHEISLFTATVRSNLMFVILETLFTNLSRDFSTKIDWLLQSHGSIGRFDQFINPTLPVIRFLLIDSGIGQSGKNSYLPGCSIGFALNVMFSTVFKTYLLVVQKFLNSRNN